MQSAWNDSDAGAAVALYENLGRDLALRVYTTRLLGRDPRLVLHGGGNTSVKTRIADLNAAMGNDGERRISTTMIAIVEIAPTSAAPASSPVP